MADMSDSARPPEAPDAASGGTPTPARSPIVTPTRVVAGVCLILPFVAMLWVGSYSRLTPEFIGIPFFYWYQMLWVLISSALTFTAYTLVRREEQARKRGERA